MKITPQIKHTFIKVVGVIIVWRVLLFIISGVADIFLPYQPSFALVNLVLEPSHLPRWLYSWANFDGVHYLTIVHEGYLNVKNIQAFFPGYPSVVWFLHQLINHSLISGLLISNLSLIVMLCLWFTLLKEEFNEKTAWVGLFVLLLFPTSFFFGAMYGESFFLSLILGAFLASRKQQWWLASLLTIVASATRIVGIFLLPALMYELYLQMPHAQQSVKNFLVKEWRKVTVISIGGLGLVSYMAFLHHHFNDPLYFFHVQSEFGGGRQESLVLFPQVIWRYLKIFQTFQPHNWLFFSIVQEFLAAIFGAVILLLSLKKIRLSYLVFAIPAFFLPALTGTFSSMGRYLLVCFPIFIWLTLFLVKRPRLMIGYAVVSTCLLIINVILFIQGYWVA